MSTQTHKITALDTSGGFSLSNSSYQTTEIYMMKLDLHGYTIHQAWKEADQFITEAYYQGHKKVIIICGHGVIKQEIEEWFALHPKVRNFTPLGNGGSYVLKIAKGHNRS